MSLGAVVDALGTYLLDHVLPKPKLSGGTAPAGATDLPAVTLSISEASRVLGGVGRLSRPPQIGALPVQISIDLAHPILEFPGEPPVTLLDTGRQTLQLPHSPLVTHTGSEVASLGSADLGAHVGSTAFEVVDAPPVGDQVQPEAETAILRFGTALATLGQLELNYFIGQWQVRAVRYQALLGVDVIGVDNAAVETVSRSVDQALLREPIGSVPGLRGISPDAWGGVAASTVSSGARIRTMRYRIDYEVEDAILPTGGGVIARIHVVEHVDAGTEEFDVAG